MTTERRGSRADWGFTLIEVLVAMVLLGIAVMALLPLGVISARQVGLADRNSRSATVATQYLEDGLQQIRQSRRPAACEVTLPNGDRVVRIVNISTFPGEPSNVTVTVTPEPRGGTPRPYTIRSYAFSPVAIADTTTPCPSP